jgi:hypothetical protein
VEKADAARFKHPAWWRLLVLIAAPLAAYLVLVLRLNWHPWWLVAIFLIPESDIEGICKFGQDFVRDHYAPLIGSSATDAQVRVWWNETHIGAAIRDECVVIAEDAARSSALASEAHGTVRMWLEAVRPPCVPQSRSSSFAKTTRPVSQRTRSQNS